MAKSKQKRVEESMVTTPPTIEINKYKPLPRFNSGCKNC